MRTLEVIRDQTIYESSIDDSVESRGFYIRLPDGKYLAGEKQPRAVDDIRIAGYYYSFNYSGFLEKVGLTKDQCTACVPLLPGMDGVVHKPVFRMKPVTGLEVVIGSAPCQLARQHPGHDIIKGELLRVAGVVPPPEACTSFELLDAWARDNVRIPEDDAILRAEELAALGPEARPQRQRNVVCTAEVEMSDTEFGRCRYSVNRYGSYSSDITAEQLCDLVGETIDDGSNFDELIENLERTLLSDAADNADLSSDGQDYDYEEHEMSDADNFESNIRNARTLRDSIRQWCQENLDEEQLSALDI